jgi:hypothetical protein
MHQLRFSPEDLSRRDRWFIAGAAVLIVVLIIIRTEVETASPPTGEAVPWADYPPGLQARIEEHVARYDCVALRGERASAEATERDVLVRTGHDNARLHTYLSEHLQALGC